MTDRGVGADRGVGTDRAAGDLRPHWRVRAVRRDLAVAGTLLVADVALAVLLFAHAWAHPTSITVGQKTDAPVIVWALAWVARALAHGQSPWVTHAMAWPGGVNLMTNVSCTLVGAVLAPVTWLWGPLVAFDVAATAALSMTAWSAQVVIRRSGLASWPAAFVGGLVAGFGPISLSQTTGAHLHVSLAFLLPPMLLGLGRLATGTARRPVMWAVAIGVLAAAQLLVGEELLAIVAIAGLVGLLAARRFPPWRLLAIAGGVFAALGAVPLWIQFFGTANVTGSLQAGTHYANDLIGLVVPSGPLWVDPGIGLARHFSSEGGAYLGVPLLVVCAMVAWRARGREQPLVRTVGVSAGVLAILALGASLTVNGHRLPIWLPWSLMAHLPLLSSLLPVRFGVVLDLAAGALLAVGLDRVAQALKSQGRHYARTPITSAFGLLASAALALVCLVPLLPRLPFPYSRWAVPAPFRHPATAGIPDGALIVTGPYPGVDHPEAGIWLAVAGARWKSSGGNYLVPDAHGHAMLGGPAPLPNVIEAAIERGVPLGVFIPQTTALLTALGHDRVAAVVIGPVAHRDVAVAFWTSVLGPPRVSGTAAIFAVPRAVTFP